LFALWNLVPCALVVNVTPFVHIVEGNAVIAEVGGNIQGTSGIATAELKLVITLDVATQFLSGAV